MILPILLIVAVLGFNNIEMSALELPLELYSNLLVG